ncbi:serine hydrolase [Candidatus Bipolaricaulota bacterium]|nr:serine hydrolase [Candidatus Bipolaricaulota bacterium]
MKRLKTTVAIFLLLVALSAGLVGVFAAGKAPEKEALLSLFTGPDEVREDLFADSFLDKVPIYNINEIVTRYTRVLGKLLEVRGERPQYTLVFETGSAPSQIALDQEGKIAGIWLGNWTLKSDTLEKLVEELKGLDGTVSLYISREGIELFSLNGEREMAVGSSFKLYVLDTLYETTSREDREEVIHLTYKHRSLPSGILQDWPTGDPVTVKTLANLMISQSDNTATDHLIELVGRDYLAENTNQKNRPFLTTVDVFNLKYGPKDLREKYVNVGKEKKREILNGFEGLEVSVSDVKNEPTLIGQIEWFFSTKELAEVIYDIRDTSEIFINPGLTTKGDWYRAGYKGGSEPGVLQYTHLLQVEESSPVYVVSLTVNNPEGGVSTDKVTEIATRIISLVREGKI